MFQFLSQNEPFCSLCKTLFCVRIEAGQMFIVPFARSCNVPTFRRQTILALCMHAIAMPTRGRDGPQQRYRTKDLPNSSKKRKIFVLMLEAKAVKKRAAPPIQNKGTIQSTPYKSHSTPNLHTMNSDRITQQERKSNLIFIQQRRNTRASVSTNRKKKLQKSALRQPSPTQRATALSKGE